MMYWRNAALATAMMIGEAAVPASAAVLDFSGNICGPAGNQACGNGSQIGQNYGDQTGVDVSYRSVVNANGTTFEAFLKHWASGYGDLTNVVWGGPDSSTTYSEITFTALAGYEVALRGFDAACYQDRAVCRTFPFSISEIGGGTVGSGNIVAPAGGHVTQTTGLGYSTSGYVLRWGPDGYDGGLDNIGFDVRAITTGGGVPEPASWALMIGGFGLAGGALRRRRSAGTVARLA